MNVLYGLHQPDEGEILLDGEPVEIDSPRRAIGLGIGMVHQHFMLVPVMTVAENLVLGAEPRSGLLLDYKEAAERVRELSERFGLAVDPDATVEDLGVGAQQRVEILRALFRGAQVLVLDEPTAVLTAQEAQDLFEVLRALKAERHGDRLHLATSSTRCSTSPTASRSCAAARRSTRCRAEGATERSLARLMVGRDVLLRVEKPEPQAPASRCSRCAGCPRATTAACPRSRDVSFEVRAGEIVGLAGVDANGQSELIETIMGLRKPDAGQVMVAGRDVTHARHARDAGRPASATSPRTATAAASCSSSTWPRTSACASTATPRCRAAAGCRRRRWSPARAGCSRSTTCAAATRDTRAGSAVGRQPAEGRDRARDRPPTRRC